VTLAAHYDNKPWVFGELLCSIIGSFTPPSLVDISTYNDLDLLGDDIRKNKSIHK